MKIKLFLDRLKYKIKINKRLIKITFIIFILFSIILLHFLLKINFLFSQIDLKNLKIRNAEEERLTVIEKAQIQKMKELIHTCSPYYYVGFYRIENNQKYFYSIEIIGDQQNPDLSLKLLNQRLFNTKFQIDEKKLKQIAEIKEDYFIVKNFEDYNESLDLLDLSKNNFDKIMVIVIKNPQGKPIFIHSLSRVEKQKNYKCNESDMANLLEKLTYNLLYLL
jgi:hypothetical protein